MDFVRDEIINKMNPPEILSLKFLQKVTAIFPLFPYEIETTQKSTNFNRDLSIYKWEYRKDEDNDEGVWTDTGCSNFIFIPEDDLVGAKIRLTCTPSSDDECCFGPPYTQEVPLRVEALPVGPGKDPLYLQRLKKNKLQTCTTCDPNILRVISYNCLAECYALDEYFPKAKEEGSLSADFRFPYLCQEFGSYNGDLYCLQEIEEKYFQEIFLPFFDCFMDFKGFLSPKASTYKVGGAIFYDPDKLAPISNETVVITNHLKKMEVWGKIPPTVMQSLEERDTVLQLAVFRSRSEPDVTIIVANTHLYFKQDAGHIRLLQAIGCVDCVERKCREILKDCCPNTSLRTTVIFCGDLNCLPDQNVVRYLTEGKIDKDEEDLDPGISPKHNLQLSNTHGTHNLTNFIIGFEGCIDYIFYQPSDHLELVTTYPPPDKEELIKVCGEDLKFPNFYAPSDHLPLIADFKIKNTDKKCTSTTKGLFCPNNQCPYVLIRY